MHYHYRKRNCSSSQIGIVQLPMVVLRSQLSCERATTKTSMKVYAISTAAAPQVPASFAFHRLNNQDVVISLEVKIRVYLIPVSHLGNYRVINETSTIVNSYPSASQINELFRPSSPTRHSVLNYHTKFCLISA